MTAYHHIVEALRANGSQVIERGDKAQSQCPAHDDQNPSLSIAARKDGKGVVLTCHAGCDYRDVLAALGLSPRDLYDDPGMRNVYRPNLDYRYAGGGVKHRRQSAGSRRKKLWREPNIHDDSLYRVEKLQPEDSLVYLTEGEKACDAIWAMGGVAVSTGGSTRTCDLSPLRGRDVIAIVDRDEAGRKWAINQRDGLAEFAKSLQLMQCAVPLDKADVVEHFDHGLTLTELVPYYLNDPIYLDRYELPTCTPTDDSKRNGANVPAPAARHARVTLAKDIPAQPVTWAWISAAEDAHEGTEGVKEVTLAPSAPSTAPSGRIAAGTVAIAAGPEGVGKSSFGIWLTAQVSNGTLPGAWYGKPKMVLYCAVEDSWKHTIVPRLIAAGANLSMVGRFDVVSEAHEVLTISLPADNELLTRAVVDHHVGLVVLDPLLSLISERLDSHHERETRVALDPLAGIADSTGAVFLGIAHWNKSGSDVTTRITGSGAFKNLPRAVFAFARNPDAEQEFILTQTKNSLGRHDLPSVRYTIESAPVDVGSQTRFYTGKFVPLGDSTKTVADVLASRDTDVGSDSLTPPQRFIISYITQHGDQDGEISASECIATGEPVGYTEDDLKKARYKMRHRVGSRKAGMKRGWVWYLTDEDLLNSRAKPQKQNQDSGTGATGVPGRGRQTATTRVSAGEGSGAL